MWGWKAGARLDRLRGHGSPTRVGMEGRHGAAPAEQPGEPHACGDGSPACAASGQPAVGAPRVWGWKQHAVSLATQLVGAPRVWGWKDCDAARVKLSRGSPTRVGMEGRKLSFLMTTQGEPHACGDGSESVASPRNARTGAPRVWGWKAGPGGSWPRAGGSPTRVGMEGNE